MAKTYPHLTDGVDSRQSIYESSTTQHHALGTRGHIDGRVFYYAKSSGAAINKGNLCRVAAGEAEHRSLSCESAAAGATSVTVTLGSVSVAQNAYAGGTFFVIDGTGSGQERIIKSHPAAAASTTLVVTLEEGLEDALVAADEATLRKNVYQDVVISPGSAVVRTAGAPQCDIPAGSTNAQYFWLQTWGPGLGVRDGTAAATEGALFTAAIATSDDAGQLTSVQTASSTDLPANALRLPIAICLDVGDTSDGDHIWVDWRISP